MFVSFIMLFVRAFYMTFFKVLPLTLLSVGLVPLYYYF